VQKLNVPIATSLKRAASLTCQTVQTEKRGKAPTTRNRGGPDKKKRQKQGKAKREENVHGPTHERACNEALQMKKPKKPRGRRGSRVPRREARSDFEVTRTDNRAGRNRKQEKQLGMNKQYVGKRVVNWGLRYNSKNRGKRPYQVKSSRKKGVCNVKITPLQIRVVTNDRPKRL